MLKIILDLFIILILFRFILYFVTKIIGWIGKYQSQSNDQGYHNNYYYNKYNKNSVKDLIKCNSCGVYIAIEESIKYNGKNFCCKEHIS